MRKGESEMWVIIINVVIINNYDDDDDDDDYYYYHYYYYRDLPSETMPTNGTILVQFRI